MIYWKSFFLAAITAQHSCGSHARRLEGRQLQQEQTFRGPGFMECFRGECTFEVMYDKVCHDACNTQGFYGPVFYDIPYIQMSNTGPLHNDGELCYHDKATNINTHFLYDGGVLIKEGCKATCKGCSKWELFDGPLSLECKNGSCFPHHITDDKHVCDKCNVKDFMKIPDIELDFDNTYAYTTGQVHDHYPFSHNSNNCKIYNINNINTNSSPIEIYDGCNLMCKGCTAEHYIDTLEGAGYLDCQGGKCMFPDSQCPGLHAVMSSSSRRGWKFDGSCFVPDESIVYDGVPQGEWVFDDADMENIVHYGIYTKEPIQVPEGCPLHCSGCCLARRKRGCKDKLTTPNYEDEE